MERAREEYVTDVPYVRAFVGDLSPVLLRLVAALNGFPQPPADAFDYCELGSAHGDTTATLAAAYPGARFVGVDINPEHIAGADVLARDGGLDNLRFVEGDFADLAKRGLPSFDFITAHGVLSWIGPAKRKSLIDFASAKLKPGGMLYVSYNALPGWAAIEPLRHLMLDRAAGVEGDRIEQAHQGLLLAKRLRDAGATYFTGNPAAAAMLDTVERNGLSYAVHEYFHAHWVPMYFAEVAEEMAASDLYYVGQLPLHLNYRDLAVPPGMTELFESVHDRVTFETLKDYAINEFFRRDVYVKGRVARDEAAVTAYFDATPFGTHGDRAIERAAKLPHYTLSYVGEVFDFLIPALAEGAATVSAFAKRPELARFGATRIRDALVRLALGGQVMPHVEATRRVSVSEGARFEVASTFNRLILGRVLSNQSPPVLASCAAGTGLPMTLLETVAIRALTEAAPDGRREWLRELLRRFPMRLKVGDLPTDAEQPDAKERALLAEIEHTFAKKLAKLEELGVLRKRAQ